MANKLYPSGKDLILDSFINGGEARTLYAALVSEGYTYNASHSVVADIEAYRRSADKAFENVRVSGGAILADDLIPGFTGLTLEQFVGGIVIHDGTTLIMFCDTANHTQFPVQIGAQRMDMTLPGGKIFSL